MQIHGQIKFCHYFKPLCFGIIFYAALNNQNKDEDDDEGRSIFKGPLDFQVRLAGRSSIEQTSVGQNITSYEKLVKKVS